VSLPCRESIALQPLSRRTLLKRCGMGFGAIGLAGLLHQDQLLAAPADALPQMRPRAADAPSC